MEKITTIKPNAIIEMSFGTEFYQRILDLTMFLIKDITREDFEKGLSQIKEQNVTEEWVRHYETLLIFCSHYEKIIIEKGLTEEREI